MTAIEYLDQPLDGYRAGACNIGPAEIARRRRSGVVGLTIAAALAVLLVVADLESIPRLAIAPPLFVGILGIIQARLRFCVGFAAAGVRNFGALGNGSRIAERTARTADLRRAIGITMAVAVVSGAIAVVFALLPV